MSGRRITRREFIQGAAIGAAGAAIFREKAFAGASAQVSKRPPNILFIQSDQLHYGAISGLGNKYVYTPNIDRLMARGITFSNSYSANPVCCPARACWYTGRTSSENGMLSNEHKLDPDIPDLGQWFRTRGYEPFYTGKWHIPGRNSGASFNILTSDPSGIGEHVDPVVSRSSQAFFSNYNGDKPFFLSVGFLQPHDCCYWVFSHKEPKEDLPYPWLKDQLPPLPDNFNYSLDESTVVQRHLRGLRNWTDTWSDLHWKYYLWSYYRHVEMVDAEIGRVLDSLDSSGYADNTMIIFTSDHGDGLGRRKLHQKWFLYDEAVRVPYIACLPGVDKDGRADNNSLVSGLDLAPTLCGFAGIDPPPQFRGRNLKPVIEGKTSEKREFIVSEANITGRMVRTPEYKLITYKDDPVEQLFDMRKDPWEMNNLANERGDVVKDLKNRLNDWEKHTDTRNIG